MMMNGLLCKNWFFPVVNTVIIYIYKKLWQKTKKFNLLEIQIFLRLTNNVMFLCVKNHITYILLLKLIISVRTRKLELQKNILNTKKKNRSRDIILQMRKMFLIQLFQTVSKFLVQKIKIQKKMIIITLNHNNLDGGINKTVCLLLR